MKGQFPWIGRSRGSAGGMTTAKINDKNVMKAKAFEVANPKTAAQIMQRNFFKQVQEVCASVSEDELRSLYGVKPKTMTRRNALSKQIAAAYTIEDGVKSVDFSKLLSIGNGMKVNSGIIHIKNANIDDDYIPTVEMMGENAKESTNIIMVVFNATDGIITIENLDTTLGEIDETIGSYIDYEMDKEYYTYATCATSGENVYDLSFGSFIIKTRATN